MAVGTPENLPLLPQEDWDNRVPFRGEPQLHSRDEPTYMRPQTVQDVHVRVFDLSDKKDLEEYQLVCNKVANGRGRFGVVRYAYDRDKKNWRVLAHWILWFKEEPGEAQRKILDL